MPNDQDSKRTERRARQLLMDKDVPKAKMEVVQSLIDNTNLTSQERYSAIIELIQNCPDKNTRRPESLKRIPHKKSVTLKQVREQENVTGPTETSFYIDSLYNKYKHLKLVKKRYLTHRNNRFGIGFRKRLIPTKKLLKLFQEYSTFQEIIMSRLTTITMSMLEDTANDDPAVFNYLRLFRKWMLDVPLIRYSLEFIKWLENQNFEREFRNFIYYLVAFKKLPIDQKEKILLQLEFRLRQQPDLVKHPINGKDNDLAKSSHEKQNLDKEKKIYNYMMILRSFISPPEKDDIISRFLLHKYKISDLATLIHIICETLIFQKPVTTDEIIRYFNIESLKIDQDRWDYSEEYLKKYGKDPQTKKRNEITILQRKLDQYDLIYRMLKYDDNGHNLLFKSVEDQWKLVDKRKQHPETVFEENFFSFLDGLINFFKNTYLPLLDGSEITFFNDRNERIEGAIFSTHYFKPELSKLHSIVDDMHYFKTNNPTLAINRREAYRIIKGQIKTMVHVERFIKMLGTFFFSMAKELHVLYDYHCRWIRKRKGGGADENDLYRTLVNKNEVHNSNSPAPLPYYNCTIKGFQNSSTLSHLLSGRQLLEDTLTDGCLINITAFCYQSALECMNENIKSIVQERKRLLNQITALKNKE